MIIAPAVPADVDLVHHAQPALLGPGRRGPGRGPRAAAILPQSITLRRRRCIDGHYRPTRRRLTDLERCEAIDIEQRPARITTEGQPVLLCLARTDARWQRQLLQGPPLFSIPSPHVKHLIRLIVRIGLAGAQKLQRIRPLDKAAVLHTPNVVGLILLKFRTNLNLFAAGGCVPVRVVNARNIAEQIPRQHLPVKAAVFVVLRLLCEIVREAQIQLVAAIGPPADARIKRLPAARLIFASPGKTLKRDGEPRLAARLELPIIPMNLSKQGIEVVPVELRREIELVHSKPRRLLLSRIKSQNHGLLPNVVIDVAAIHKENILIVRGGACGFACGIGGAELERVELLEKHTRNELGFRLFAVHRNEAHCGLGAVLASLPGLQPHLCSIRRAAHSLVALAEIELRNVGLLVPASERDALFENWNRLCPVAHTEIGLTEIEVCPMVVLISGKIFQQEANIPLILVRLTATVAVIREDRRFEKCGVFARRTRPGLVRPSFTDPGLRAAQEAHIAVDETAICLFETDARNILLHCHKRISRDGIREHHIAVKEESPSGHWIPSHLAHPLLAALKRFGPTGPEVLKREGVDFARHSSFTEKLRGEGDRIVRRAGITDDNAIDAACYGAHQPLNDARFVFDHTQKDEAGRRGGRHLWRC